MYVYKVDFHQRFPIFSLEAPSQMVHLVDHLLEDSFNIPKVFLECIQELYKNHKSRLVLLNWLRFWFRCRSSKSRLGRETRERNFLMLVCKTLLSFSKESKIDILSVSLRTITELLILASITSFTWLSQSHLSTRICWRKWLNQQTLLLHKLV